MDDREAGKGTDITGEAGQWPSELDEEEEEAGEEIPETKATPSAPPPPVRAKANTLNRSIARFIDILIALLLARLPGYIGFFAGLTYIGVADGLFSGRGVGKRIVGLRVVYKDGGRAVDFRGSILRNSTMGALYLVFHIPFVGWILAVLGLGFELLLIIGSSEGMRLGDEIAGTAVEDIKNTEI